MREMLLDREGDMPVPPGYLLVTSEVDFLRSALESSAPLMVRKASLCNWATAFFQARRIPWREVRSPVRELVALCPKLSVSQARIIHERLQDTFFDLSRPLSVSALLNALYPNRLWSDQPSLTHAAQWLLWLDDCEPDDVVRPLLDDMCGEWQRQAETPLSAAYAARHAEAANAALDSWLRIADDTPKQFPDTFPLPVPNAYKASARRDWKEALIRTKGEYLVQLDQRIQHPELRQLAVQEAVGYFRAHPEDLTEDRLVRLAPHLTLQKQSELRKQLPPPVPSPLPTTIDEVLRWFDKQYLPYRFWLAENQADDQMPVVQERAHEFALWYLEHYPQALSGSPLGRYLSFARSASLDSSEQHITTLVIVLDGMHVADARHLQLKIEEQVQRLTPVSREFAFAPLPTVTAFCKDALFRGVPPSRTSDVAPIGDILPESKSPVDLLSSAEPGHVYLWRVLEPDNTYHKRNNFDTLRREVEAQLDSIATKISDIVAHVSTEISLRIVITTDHGRLLARSSRRLPIPDGMQSHGRAAWGSTNRSYPAEGYIIEGNVVFLHGDRFGLPCEAALALGEDSFLTSDGKTGSERYAHGGLYPEEVIIPWFVYARDIERAVVKITIKGGGQVHKTGQIEVDAVNSSDIPVTLTNLRLDLGHAGKRVIPLNWQIAPRSPALNRVDVESWPSEIDAKLAKGTVQFKQPNGLAFDVEVQVDLHSEAMYARDDILEGLDL